MPLSASFCSYGIRPQRMTGVWINTSGLLASMTTFFFLNRDIILRRKITFWKMRTMLTKDFGLPTKKMLWGWKDTRVVLDDLWWTLKSNICTVLILRQADWFSYRFLLCIFPSCMASRWDWWNYSRSKEIPVNLNTNWYTYCQPYLVPKFRFS